MNDHAADGSSPGPGVVRRLDLDRVVQLDRDKLVARVESRKVVVLADVAAERARRGEREQPGG